MRREYPSVPGPGRAIVVTLFVLALLAVGADFGLRLLAESRLATAAQSLYGLPERPDLALRGFPFLLQVARSRFEEVAVEVEDVELEGLAFDRVTLTLEDATFPRESLLSGIGVVTSSGGHAEVVIGEEAISAYLQEEVGVAVRVRFAGPGVRVSTRVSVGGETTTASAGGRVRVEGDALLFEPGAVEVEGSIGVPAAALAFEAPLPEVVPGVTYERVVVEEGVARVQATLAGAQLELSG